MHSLQARQNHAPVADYSGVYAATLEQLGQRPYRHQVQALEHIAAGAHVVLATPTASGKSLSYQLPILTGLSQGQQALCLFPTKALAHDQVSKLRALAEPLGYAEFIASYDGDSSAEEKRALRHKLQTQAHCLFSNPDMLHYGILPQHRRWARWLAALRYIVIDEVHSYRGVMGVHVANILQRLLRLAQFYGAAPQCIAASATIANPAEHAQRLTALPFVAVTESYSPRAAREILFWQAPPRRAATSKAATGDDDNDSDSSDVRRRSSSSEAAFLAVHCLRAGLKCIVFCNGRRRAELVQRYAQAQLRDDEKPRLQSYRAGYSSKERRRLEQAFRTNQIDVLTATSALELGMDIGSVDAVLLLGYPGSMTALWQRAGRAGRRDTRALVLFIADEDPLDAYYLQHPEAVLEAKAEAAITDPHNAVLHPRHLACAAYEQPLQAEESIVANAELQHIAGLVQSPAGWYYQGRYPHGQLSIRGISSQRIRLYDGSGQRLGSSDLETALRELHPGAVYLHQGESYLVAKLDLEARRALLLPHIDAYYSQVRHVTEIDPQQRQWQQGRISCEQVQVRRYFPSFVRKRYYSERVLEEQALELPELCYPSQALCLRLGDVVSALTPALIPEAIHALEHVLIALLPVFVLCERADIGGVSYPLHPAYGEACIFIYDGYPGGVGYAYAGAQLFPVWLEAARERLAQCSCRQGCPRCILSPKCGNGNQYLNKAAALELATLLQNRLTSALSA